MARDKEVFISVDVEASGPVPADYSLLSIGACIVEHPSEQFYVELQPIVESAVPAALHISGLSLSNLKETGTSPLPAMKEFARWIERHSKPAAPVFVGFNAPFDWSFVNWYFHHFLGVNPFGISGIDIKAFYMALAGCRWSETTSKQLPANLRPKEPLTHNALQDAIMQGEIFCKLLAISRGKAL